MIKDDFKLIAQAEIEQVAYLVTDDSETLFKFCGQFKDTGRVSFRAIRLEDGFKMCFLNTDGQGEIWNQSTEADPQGNTTVE